MAAVSFYELIQNLVHDTLGNSLAAFRPELTVVATIVALLLVRMLDRRRRIDAFYVMAAGSALALAFTAPWHYLQGQPAMGPIFTGMLVFDTFSVYMRALLLFFVLLFATFTRITGVPDRDDATEFYVLILGATLGMCLMVSAKHMLIVFLGIEMASVPSYALAGILRNRRTSSEAALKFAVFGAGTAGVMLYGISLLVGVLGSAHLPTMAVAVGQRPGRRRRPAAADGAGPGWADGDGRAWPSSSPPCLSTSGPPTSSRAPRPRWTPFSPSPPRRPPWRLLVRLAIGIRDSRSVACRSPSQPPASVAQSRSRRSVRTQEVTSAGLPGTPQSGVPYRLYI